MGCGSAKEMKISHDLTSSYAHNSESKSQALCDADQLLKPEEALLVRLTWQELRTGASLAILGKKVFLRIFNLKPEIKKLFPFGDAWGDELIKHPKFITHAERFMIIIDCCVQNLERIRNECSDMLVNLGRSHVAHRGFNKENFEVFMKAIWFVWHQELKDKLELEVEVAWKKLLMFIIAQQTAGYESELKKGQYTAVVK